MSSDQPIVSPSISQLVYLVAIADSPTWAAAASSLGVSPSALSQGIAELERRLGIALFERVGRRRVLSDRSSDVLAYARRIVSDTKELSRWLEDARAGASLGLRLGMIDAAAVGHYGAELQSFRRERPEVQLRLTVAPSSELIALLQQNVLDVAVVVRPPVRPVDIETIDLITEPLGLYVPADSAVGSPNTWGPWIAFPESSHTRQLIVSALASLGASYEVVAESHQPEVVRHMVNLGLGWAVLPIVQAEQLPNPLVLARPEPVLERTLVAARRTHALPHPLVEEFVGLLSRSAVSRR